MRLNKSTLFTVGLVLAFAAAPVFAQQNAGGVLDNLTGQFSSGARFLLGFCFIAGIGCLIQAILKFKAHGQPNGQTGIKEPIIYALAAVLLICLPAFAVVGKHTVFSGAGQSATVDGSTYGAISN